MIQRVCCLHDEPCRSPCTYNNTKRLGLFHEKFALTGNATSARVIRPNYYSSLIASEQIFVGAADHNTLVYNCVLQIQVLHYRQV
jgi:hypothetical protein